MYVTLYILFLIHWYFTIFFCTYVFWANPIYDKIYIVIASALILHWAILGNCIISHIEIKMLGIKNTQFTYHPSLYFYQDMSIGTVSIMCIISVLIIYNIYIVLQRQRVNKTLIYSVLLFMCTSAVYYRYKDFKYLIGKQIKQSFMNNKN